MRPALRTILLRFAGTAWDPANKSTRISLSGGNLVATATAGASATTFVRVTPGKSTGKFYAEFVYTTRAGAGMGVGLVNGTPVPDTDSVSATANSLVYWDDGNVYQNGVSLAILQTLAQGDRVCVAINVGTSHIWFRKAAASWNESGGADPATDIGGLTFTATVPVYLAVRMDTSGDVMTANFGGTAFTHTPPVGFGNW